MNQKDFATRVQLLQKRLYRTAYLFLGNETSALETVDETIYKGLKSLWQLRQPEYFDTWLTRILINECKRERKRLSRLSPTNHLPEEQTTECDYDTLPLKEAVKKLPVALREVIILRFFSEYTLAETAKTLHIPQGTVVTRQRRALALLKLELREEEPI